MTEALSGDLVTRSSATAACAAATRGSSRRASFSAPSGGSRRSGVAERSRTARRTRDVAVVTRSRCSELFPSGWAALSRGASASPSPRSLDAVDAASDIVLGDGLSFERERYQRTLLSEGRLEALTAFAAKRKPEFRGE